MTTVEVMYGKADLFLLGTSRLDVDELGIGETLVDISDRVVSLSVSRGRSDALEPTPAGRASVTVRNRDGELDPLNVDSALYPGVEPGRTLTVSADGVMVFSGQIEDISLFYDAGGAADVTVSAVDGLAALGIVEIPEPGVVLSQSASGTQIRTLITSDPRWWTAGTAIATGDATLAAGTADGNLLQQLRVIETSEGGFLFVSRDGDLTFRERTFGTGATPLLLADDDTGVRYEQLQRLTSADSLRTAGRAERGTAVIEVQDDVAIERFGVRVLDLGVVTLLSDAAVEQRLEFELARRSAPAPTVSEVTTSQLRSAGTAVLGLELGDPVTVVYTPPGMAEISQFGVVQRVGHDWTVGAGWRTRIGLDSREVLYGFILGEGMLDVDRLSF